tara:strand:+ start:749 stop:1090 length:342 start_codon:yes stop_codon:yes gene_type:complete
MDIEPLKTILSYSNDKKDTLLNFLEKRVREKIIKLEYEDKRFYINDKIYCIKRNTLELEYIGKIYCIEDDHIGIKLSNVRNVNINPDKYYIFVKIKSKDMKKRDFYKQLLEQL